MSDGTEKPIEEVKVGDWVITHKGRARQVTAISGRWARPGEEAIKSWAKGCFEPLITSADHGFAAVRGNEKCFCGCGGSLPYDYKGVKWDRRYLHGHGGHHKDDSSVEDCSQGRLVWPVAGLLSQFDYLYFPRIKWEGTTEVIPELASLLGYYLAEGSLIKHKVGNKYQKTGKQAIVCKLDGGCYNLYGVAFTLNLDERDTLAADIMVKAKAFLGDSVDVSIRPRAFKGRRWLQVIVNDPNFAALMLRYSGYGSKEKRLSPETWKWDLEAMKEVLSSYALGDGHLDESGQQYVFSISRHLITQVSTILFSLGVWNGHLYQDWQGKKNIGRRKKNRYHRLYWDYRRYPQVLDKMRDRLRPHVLALVESAGDCIQGTDYWGDGFLRCLYGVEKAPAPLYFHDISVNEDESFIANRILVHNCKAVFERILPAVQHNIVKIVREREVKLNKERLEQQPPSEKEKRLRERQEEMRKKKKIDKIVRVEDEETQKKMIDELVEEESQRMEREKKPVLPPPAPVPAPPAPAPAPPLKAAPPPKAAPVIKRDEPATKKPPVPVPKAPPAQPDMRDLIRQEEEKLQKGKNKPPAPRQGPSQGKGSGASARALRHRCWIPWRQREKKLPPGSICGQNPVGMTRKAGMT